MEMFRCGSEDHLIVKCPKPPEYNDKQRKQVRFIEKGIVLATTARTTVNKIYMQLWHACLVMMNFLVEILVTVHNRPI